MLTLISWNIAHRTELWQAVLKSNADVALLQEACEPPADVARRLGDDVHAWRTRGSNANRRWRTCIVRLNDQIEMQTYSVRPLEDAGPEDLATSCPGTLAAAVIRDPRNGEAFTLVSLYAPWERPHQSTSSSWIYADASAHRLVSDLSMLIGRQHGHRIIAAGDLNILHGYGEEGSSYWAARYKTVFDRMAALGLLFVGPQAPHGRQADPWPGELPRSSRNVPTFRSNRQTPASATRQLDFVFASTAIADRLIVRALNSPQEWGPSDHCRIEIRVKSAE